MDRMVLLLFELNVFMDLNPMSLVLNAPILSWDEAIPLGNGLTGALIWGNKNILNISMDRGDIWDNRIVEAFNTKDFSWKHIQQLVAEKNQKAIATLFDIPYDKIPYPTKLPVGRIMLSFDKKVKFESFILNFKTGEATVQICNSNKKITLFFDQTRPLLVIQSDFPIKSIQCKGPGDKREKRGSHSPINFKSLGYRKYKAIKSKSSCGFEQSTISDGNYSLYGEFTNNENNSLIGISVSNDKKGNSSLQQATSLVKGTLAKNAEIENIKGKGQQWWEKFWGTTKIEIPDSKILQDYNITQYFYGAASRKGAPPIPLQGVWTADTEALPPWKGDYHFDLNVQQTYWACLNSGKFASAESLLDFMWDLIPEHRKFAESFFDSKEGIAVPGVMTLNGKPMGGWAMYSLSPVQGIWLAQHFYWQWSYTQDREYLVKKAYPYLKMISQPIMHILKQHEDGFYYLPLSASPEIHDNTLKAWLKPNSNYDLALLKWLFGALEKCATELNLSEDLTIWKKYIYGLAPLAVNGQKALKISPNEDLPDSHRHFSHLMAIYPLQILDSDKPEDKQTIIASLTQIEELGTKQWCGYSFSWMAAIYAQLCDGEHAFSYLSKFVNAFVTRNFFHVNGDQSGKGYSSFTYRPFTLEGNFAAAQALHEMLLQSLENKIRIFPAIPKSWQEINFKDLFVQGGHCISATMNKGETRFISLIAGRDGLIFIRSCNLINPIATINGKDVSLDAEGTYYRFNLKKGQKLELKGN